MKLATYNVENMFDRAKALNTKSWSEGKPVLEAYTELNTIFNKPVYSTADKDRILLLLTKYGLLKTDEGPLLLLRKIRGKLLNRPKSGAVQVVATGRSDWIGWMELKTEPVKATATENIGRVMGAVGADVLCVVEAEDRTTLRLFNKAVLNAVGVPSYNHIMLIDGNDDRGIDVGILTKSDYEITSIRSHVDDTDTKGVIFSRDCAEYEIRLSSGMTVWVMVNHLKSKGYGTAAANDAKRKRQAKRIRELYDQHLETGDKLVAVVGDFNDTPKSAALAPLLGGGSAPRDISAHPKFDDGGRQGTFGNCTPTNKIDYMLLSPLLFARVKAAGIERRGMWGGKNGTLWPHFAELASEQDTASDHAALWAEFDL